MRAAVTTTMGGPLELAEVDDPTPGEGELVVSVAACGICGSDLHLVDAFELPGLVLGHEFAGRVEAVGSGVSGWSEGDPVVPLSLASCGTCDACRDGRPRKCPTVQMVGVETPGAYAEYVRVPAHDTLGLPAGFDVPTAAVVEPLAVARHSVGRAGSLDGERVLVVGAGPVGAAVLLWLATTGAASVAVSDPRPDRRAQAADLGADLTLDPAAGDLADQLREAVGVEPSVVFECVGLPGLIESSCAAAAVDGRVVVVGVCMAPDHFVPMTAMAKELDLRYAFYYCRSDFEATIAAIDDGALDPSGLITGTTALDGLPDRFEALKHPAPDANDLKVLVQP